MRLGWRLVDAGRRLESAVPVEQGHSSDWLRRWARYQRAVGADVRPTGIFPRTNQEATGSLGHAGPAACSQSASLLTTGDPGATGSMPAERPADGSSPNRSASSQPKVSKSTTRQQVGGALALDNIGFYRLCRLRRLVLDQ